MIPERVPSDINTLYDIASLTKVLATATLTMILINRGLISLDDTISSYIQDFKHDNIKIIDVLNHQSGLLSWKPYYLEASGKEGIYKKVNNEELECPTGDKSVYSDIDFIILGELLEKITERSIDKLFEEEIAEKIGLNNTFFIPISRKEDFRDRKFAATEKCPYRDRVIIGEVHDENSYAMGGVSGHAGLFSNAFDIYLFSREIINSYKNNGELLLKDVMDELLSTDSPWALGWDRPFECYSLPANLFSRRTIGHLGFTGCSLWIDLKREVIIILLTNRIHPSRDNNTIKFFRPIFNDEVNNIIERG
jgi:CubicO group peptidase (beta-lactamase class C family)